MLGVGFTKYYIVLFDIIYSLYDISLILNYYQWLL